MSAADQWWRVGRSYGIHVYTDSGERNEDIAVATFHDPEDAFVAVEAHNAALRRRAAEKAADCSGCSMPGDRHWDTCPNRHDGRPTR